jgi:predicted dehydrogenase
MGIHLTDLFLWLMGDWKEVRAVVNAYDQAIGVENAAMAMGNITWSAISPREESYLRLTFSR